MTLRVVVTDLEQRAALAAVRSLGAAGEEVHGIGSRSHAIAKHSRYLRSATIAADPMMNAAEFADRVYALAADVEADVVVPVSEAAHLALYGAARGASWRLAAPPTDSFTRAANKALAREAALACGLAAPQQALVQVFGQWDTESVSFPCAIKPMRTVSTDAHGSTKAGVSYASSPSLLRNVIASYPASVYPLLVQQRVVGTGFGVSILRWEGRTLAVSAHRRLREKPVSGGVSVAAETVDVPDHLMARCESLLDAVDFPSGVAMIEFKGESLDNPWFIEINPRLWGTVQLAINAGVDMPLLLTRAAIGVWPSTIQRARSGVRMFWFWGSIDHMLARVRRGLDTHGNPAAGARADALRTLWPTLWPDAEEEVFRSDDWRPFAMESWNWLQRR